MTPTPKVLQSLVNLRANDDFGNILEWLGDSLSEFRNTCEKAPADLQLYRAQGSAHVCRTLLDANTQAPAKLDKIKSKR